MKLVGELFKDEKEYYQFITDIVDSCFVNPNRLQVCIIDDIPELYKINGNQSGIDKNIYNDALASFVSINKNYLPIIKAGKDKYYHKDTEGVIDLYTSNLENYLNEVLSYLKISTKDILKITILHECRHAQQFFYILDNYGYDLYNQLLTYDEFVYTNNVDSYYNSPLELDAQSFAEYTTLKKSKYRNPWHFKLDKVINAMWSNMINSGLIHEIDKKIKEVYGYENNR